MGGKLKNYWPDPANLGAFLCLLRLGGLKNALPVHVSGLLIGEFGKHRPTPQTRKGGGRQRGKEEQTKFYDLRRGIKEDWQRLAKFQRTL